MRLSSNHKIGLTLSGGGVKGIAHAGVIKAMQERDIIISQITGASAGALVGALYAAGVSVERIVEFFETSRLFHPRKFAFRQPGFINSQIFKDHLSSFISHDSFEALDINLKIVATDLDTMQAQDFNSGLLYDPLLASAAFPGIFTPVQFNNALYIDGGVLNNFPVDLIENCDVSIGSYVNKVAPLNGKTLKHSYDIANRALAINQYAQDRVKFSSCDILIEPEGLYDYGLFSFRAIRNIFDIGYESACKKLDTVLEE